MAHWVSPDGSRTKRRPASNLERWEMRMITLAQCAAFSGLASHEMILGAVPSTKHHTLLSSYLLSLHRGAAAVREMIVSDLRGFLDLGAIHRAADLLVVLRLFLFDCPEARRASHRREQASSFRLLRSDAAMRHRCFPSNAATSTLPGPVRPIPLRVKPSRIAPPFDVLRKAECRRCK